MQSIDSQKISTINNIKKVLSKYYINSKGEFHITSTGSLIREAAKKEKREIPERTSYILVALFIFFIVPC